MFGTLIESRAVTPRRTGGSVASILIHSAIITGGVLATAKDTIPAPPQAPPAPVFRYVSPVDPPPATQRSASSSSASVASAPILPRLTMPAIVPVGIPPIDPMAMPTPNDFRGGPISGPTTYCEQDCANPTARSDSAGRRLWGTRDLLMRLLENPVPPRYPEAMRRAGVEGDVVVKFIVDTTGRVDMGSLEVLRSTHDAFTAAARETLAKLRFAPATTGERKTRALAVMPFHFTLR